MRLLCYLSALFVSIPFAAGAFMGMGGADQSPYCARACHSVLGSANLTCSHMMDMGDHAMMMASPDCRANDESWLTSLAYCFDAKCDGKVPLWQLEKVWAETAMGVSAVPAEWSYQEAREHVTEEPHMAWMTGHTLNMTMTVPDAMWTTWNHFMPVMDWNNILLFRYSLVLLVVGFATPITLTVLPKLPVFSTIASKLRPYLVWPSTIRSIHSQSLPWQPGNPPTMGQGLYIFGFLVLNIILSCIGYVLQWPMIHPWGYDHRGEVLAYAGYRTGEFAFALLPLAILFAGRNNVLLWITNWSHATYLLLHRWVARLFALHTILHSVFLLAARIQTGTYKKDLKLPYWQWSIVGTVFVCVMLVWSVLWTRRLSYEIFLIGHIIMTIFTIVGSWYYLILRFGYGGDHEYWLYAAVAVWAFDRVWRVVRIATNGVRRAVVTDIDANHVRVEIPGIRFSGKPGYHGYVYFPTLSRLKPWENHPFSVNSTSLIHSFSSRHGSSEDSLVDNANIDKLDTQTHTGHVSANATTTAGVTLYIRKSTGLTRLLQQHGSLITLLDGPYPNNLPAAVLGCDRLLLIGGGIGITRLLAFTNAHINVKLAWGIKQADSALATELDRAVRSVADHEIRIGERLNIRDLLEQEILAGYKKLGVVICGPPSLCDDVRALVSSLGRHKNVEFELEVDAFAW